MTLKIVRLTKTKSVIVLSILALLIAVGVAMFGPSPSLPRVAASASGHIVKLEAWHFKRAPVRYDLPNRPWARQLEQLLPDRVKRSGDSACLNRQSVPLSHPTFKANRFSARHFPLTDRLARPGRRASTGRVR